MDITESRLTETESAQARATLEALLAARTAELAFMTAKFNGLAQQPIPVYILDDGFFSYSNQCLAELFGFASPTALVERVALLDLVVPEDRLRVGGQLQALLAGNLDALQCAFTGLRTDGGRLTVAAYGHRLVCDERVSIIGILHDITERERARAARDAALGAAEELTRLKAEFVANVGHELRTPLNGVIGMASVGLRTTELPKAHQAIERILACARQLLGAVENLLDFSELAAEPFTLVPVSFDPTACIHRVATGIRAKCLAKRLNFRLDIAAGLPARCIGDERRISQVLAHLLDNAVKFTGVGTVSLAVGWEDRCLQLQVADTGVGMSTEHLARLFRPFEQADGSITRRHGGLGLGLALVRRLLERMGGTIQVRSTPGRGTVCEARVPLAEVGLESPERTMVAAGTRLAGVSVLVVGGLAASGATLAGLLEREGATVSVAAGGAAALNRVKPGGDAGYDIVFTGLYMPDVNGYELARQIQYRAPELPVIAVLSAVPSEEEARHCEAAGIRSCLVQPIEADEVVRCVLEHRHRTG